MKRNLNSHCPDHNMLPEGKCEVHLGREKTPMISIDKGVRKRM